MLCMLFLCACVSSFAANPVATVEYASPHSASSSQWNSASSYSINSAVVGSSIGFHASWQGCWDADSLYLLVTVKDNDFQSNTGNAGWNGDAAEVYFRPTNGAAIQIAVTAAGEQYKNASYFNASVERNAANGYVKYFFRIPSDKLYSFADGTLYLDFAVNYSMQGQVTRESQYSWGDDPHANMSDPTRTFGVVTLNASQTGGTTLTDAISVRALGNRTSIYAMGDFACLVATVDAEAAADPTLTYEWRKDGVRYTGKNDNNNNIRPTAAGAYTCVITYAGGTKMSVSDPVTITTVNNADKYLRKNDASTNLPILVIRTGDTALPGWEKTNHCGTSCTPAKTKVPVDMKIIWNGDGNLNSLADMADNAPVYYDRKARLNYRGSTSRTMAKKSLALSTCKKNLDAEGNVEKGKVGLFDLPEEKDWVLYAAYQDKSMMRNKLAMDLANAIGYYASAARFVELYIDGEYWGVYVLLEKYEQSENRIHVTKEPEGNTDASQLGYVLKFDKVNLNDKGTWYRGDVKAIRNLPCLDGNCFQARYTGCGSHGGCGDAAAASTRQGWEVVYPDPEGFADTTDYRFQYIKTFLTNMEIALYNATTDADYEMVFEEFIDLQSFADFMLLEELARNTDGYRASMWFSKDAGGKLKCVAPWDFEMGYGNSRTHGGSLTNIWQHMYTASETCNGLNFGDSEPYYPIPFWWEKLKRSTCFKNMLKTRWETLRQTVLSKNAVWNRIDNMVTELTAANAVQREMERWPWATRNTCVTGCRTPAYNNCPWIILPWGDNMTNSEGVRIHPIPANMPQGFEWGEYTSDNGGRKTLTFPNEYMLLKGWIADRLLAMDSLVAALDATVLDEDAFCLCAKSPLYDFVIEAADNITEICDDGTVFATLTVKNNIPGTSRISYQWKKDDVEIAGATSASYPTNEAGVYVCDVIVEYLGGIPVSYQHYAPQITVTDRNCATVIEHVEDDEYILSITVYDILGAELAKYASLDEMGGNLPAGVSIVKVETSRRSFVKKLLVR